MGRVDKANIAIADARGTIGADYNRLEHASQDIGQANGKREAANPEPGAAEHDGAGKPGAAGRASAAPVSNPIECAFRHGVGIGAG